MRSITQHHKILQTTTQLLSQSPIHLKQERLERDQDQTQYQMHMGLLRPFPFAPSFLRPCSRPPWFIYSFALHRMLDLLLLA